MDLYVLQSFLFFFLLMLLGFGLLLDAFTFFELLDDVARHHVPMRVVANYFRYLAPYWAYQLAPLAALVGVLVTLGVMTKSNEITAFKAAGISLYRLSLPLLVAGVALAAAMFLLDDTYLPYANQKQAALRNQIKGRPAQTFYQPRRQWIFGEGSKLYKYDLFDPDRNLFGGLDVFELDPATFQLRRRVFAMRAHWEGRLKTWVLEEGWVRDFDGSKVGQYLPFPVLTVPELTEPPSYFQRKVLQSDQMDWRELRQYIHDLEQAGFEVARLSVQWHRKFAFPLLAPGIVLLAIPLAFLVGTRGALGGLALAVAIAIVYWAVSALFEALGGVGQLPPFLAAWTPDSIFAFVGLYLFLKMST
jgi:LPS export ABC transporter permease LptG